MSPRFTHKEPAKRTDCDKLGGGMVKVRDSTRVRRKEPDKEKKGFIERRRRQPTDFEERTEMIDEEAEQVEELRGTGGDEAE